jgi:hypothetical protein
MIKCSFAQYYLVKTVNLTILLGVSGLQLKIYYHLG